MKIVINNCYGGFGLSDKAMYRYAELAGIKLVEGEKQWDCTVLYKYEVKDENHFWEGDFKRDDPFLVQVVEELGEEANGWAANLKVVDIPDDVNWTIEEYDGIEWVSEVHRTWS